MINDPIPVRLMQVGDVPTACEILNQIIAIGGTTAHETPYDTDRFAASYLQGTDLICCHVALDPNGNVAGFQWLGRGATLPDDCGDIATFARAEPKLRGIGTALFAATRAAALDNGLSQINATIRADNVPGLAYYGKMGFGDHSVTSGVPLQDGTPVDRISKRCALTG